MDFKLKYLKYRNKYLSLKNNIIPDGITNQEKYGGNGEYLIESLNESDGILVQKAKEFATLHCDKLYPLVAAMSHEDGTIVYGFASRGPLSNDVHGEHSVLTNARIKDHDRSKFKSLVCVTLNLKFKSPCGNCRELLKHHYPNLDIIVIDYDAEIPNKLVKIKSKYLLPYPYQSGETREESKLDKPIDIIRR
jgi:cytidine deaminase